LAISTAIIANFLIFQTDTGGELCELYGTWGERKFMGKTYMGIGRSTFVIDKQGKLAKVNYTVKAKGHAQAILERVQGL